MKTHVGQIVLYKGLFDPNWTRIGVVQEIGDDGKVLLKSKEGEFDVLYHAEQHQLGVITPDILIPMSVLLTNPNWKKVS